MDALKALKEKLKQEKASVPAGPNKYVKRSQLEEARLQKIREEEAREREEKERKRKLQSGQDDEQAAKAARQDSSVLENTTQLLKEEVIRRLRALGQPATLFGEDEFDRIKRLKKAEQEMKVVEDEDGLVAGKGNSLIELQRQSKAQQVLGKGQGAAGKRDGAAGGGGGGGGASGKAAADGGKGRQATPEPQQAGDQAEPSGAGEGGEGGAGGEEDPTMAAFKRAAAQLAERRAEEAMHIHERIAMYLQRWSKEWEEDLDRRPQEVKESGSGHQATLTFRQTMKYLEPLYERLKHGGVNEELLTGMWMMVQAMRDRNYLQANDIYLKLAIGNAPWPIGVTSVGIHERSAREKISHVMNVHGQAHIMNDEATRKYLQAMKRVTTQLQRLHPTDPSRSVDFDTVADPGKGASGAGSTKLALLEAEQKGEKWQTLGLPSAPHFMDHDGSVRIPEKWQNIMARAIKEQSPGPDGHNREGSPAVMPPSRSQR